MQITVDYKDEIERVKRELSWMRNKAVDAAANRANNRTAVQVRTEAVRSLGKEIGKATGLSAAGFRRSMRIIRSTRRTLRAAVVASGRPLPLIGFAARQTTRGVTAAAWGKRKLYRGAFIARMPTGHRGVYARTSKKRLPIRELWGPSIPKVFIDEHVQRSLKTSVTRRWPRNFQRELNYYLRRFNG